MIRLTLLLGAGLFAAMLIGGQDRGQVRFGLMPATQIPVAPPEVVEQSGAAQAVAAAEPAGADQAIVDQVVADVVNPQPMLPVQEASFAPSAPVMETPQIADATEVLAQPATGAVAVGDVGAAKILFVAANSVNVRDGPGKDYGVISRLVRGEAVLVVSAGEGPDGWSLIRIEGDGVEGYVASRLLTE